MIIKVIKEKGMLIEYWVTRTNAMCVCVFCVGSRRHSKLIYVTHFVRVSRGNKILARISHGSNEVMSLKWGYQLS